MRILLIIMADVLVAVTALLAVNEYHGIKRRDTFTVPFTDKLIACGAVAPEKRASILKADAAAHAVGIGLCAAVWIMLSAFFAGISGWIVFPVVAAGLLVALRPELGETEETRRQYYNAHKDDIDDIRYHKYLESQKGA